MGRIPPTYPPIQVPLEASRGRIRQYDIQFYYSVGISLFLSNGQLKDLKFLGIYDAYSPSFINSYQTFQLKIKIRKRYIFSFNIFQKRSYNIICLYDALIQSEKFHLLVFFPETIADFIVKIPCTLEYILKMYVSPYVKLETSKSYC